MPCRLVSWVTNTIACLTIALACLANTDKGLAQSDPVDGATATILTRTVLIAINHANQTGNYAVLRDLGSPAFAASNSPASLAVVFTKLRQRNFDLSPVVLFNPQFTQKPIIDQNGRLRMTGFFPTQPVRINFDLLFDRVDSRWRIFGISINPSQIATAANPARSETQNSNAPAAAAAASNEPGAVKPAEEPPSVGVPALNPKKLIE